MLPDSALESVARATYYKYIYIKYYFQHVIYTNRKSKVKKNNMGNYFTNINSIK